MNSLNNTIGTRLFGKKDFTPNFAVLASLILALALLVPQLTMAQSLNGSRAVQGTSPSTMDADVWQAVGSGLDSPAFAMVTLGDSLYVAGSFDNANGVLAHKFARLNHTNDTWEQIHGPQDNVTTMAVHDGKIYLGGLFENVDGEAYTHLAIYTPPDGVITGGWSAPAYLPDGPVLALAVQDGYLYVGGTFQNIGLLAVDGAARYNISSGLWETIGGVVGDYFGSDFGTGHVSAIATDGTHIFFSGSFTVNLNDTPVPGVIQ